MPGTWPIVLDLWWAEREGAAGLARRQGSRFAALLADTRRESRFCPLPDDGVALSDLPVVSKRELMAAFDDWVTDPDITRPDVEAFIADPSLIARPYCGK